MVLLSPVKVLSGLTERSILTKDARPPPGGTCTPASRRGCRGPVGIRRRRHDGARNQAQSASIAQGRRGGGHGRRTARPSARPASSPRRARAPARAGSSRPARSARSPSPSATSRVAWASRRGERDPWAILGGPNFPEDPTDLGPLVPLPGGWLELFQYLSAAGFTQIEFAGYGQNAAQSRWGPTQPDDQQGRLSRLCGDAARLPRRQRARGDRQPRVHPEHLARPEQPGRRHVDGRLRPVPDRARVRLDPRHAIHGHGQRPDERQQPQHRAVDARRREVGRAQRPQHRPGASTSIRTTTRRPTTSCRTARW